MERKEGVRATMDTEIEKKSLYELLQNACMAKLVETFKPVQMALKAL